MNARLTKTHPSLARIRFIRRRKPTARWFDLVRGVWFLLISLDLGLFIGAIPTRYVELGNIAGQSRRAFAQFAPSAPRTLSVLQRLSDYYANSVFILEIVVVCVFCLSATLIVWRRANDGWALFVALAHVTYVLYIAPPLDVLLTAQLPWRLLANFMQAIGIGCGLIFLYCLPDGRLTLRWTRPLALLWVLFTLAWGLFPNLPFNLAQPFQLPLPWFLVLMGWLLTGALAQFSRYRRLASPAQRQQTKMVVICLMVAIFAYMVIYGVGLVLRWQPQPSLAYMLYDLLYMPLTLLLILPIPFAIIFSIYRYHLFDIEFMLNRALVYSVLMALLTIVFFSCELALQRLFPMVMGSSLPIVVASSILTTVTLKPLQQRVQVFIDRRFFRHKYDAAQTVALFSATMRDEIDLVQLAARLERVIAETLHPTHVLTWLNTPSGYALYLFSTDPAIWPMAEVPADDPLVAHCLETPGIVELGRVALNHDIARSPAVHMLRAAHVELVAPLLAHEELIGWLGLGPRASGQKYSIDDLRLLNTLAAQVTPALRVAQMVAAQQAATLAAERVEQALPLAQSGDPARLNPDDARQTGSASALLTALQTQKITHLLR